MRRDREDTPREIGDLIRFGRIAEVDLAAARIIVADGELLTGPIRWFEVRAGATRTWSAPIEGEQVMLFCPEGEIGAAVALRGVPCDAFPPIGDDEIDRIRFSDGAIISYDPQTHELVADLPGGSTATVSADGGITLNGNVTINGTLNSTGDATIGGKSFLGHVHKNVQAGSANSGTIL